MAEKTAPAECANCGAEIPPRARACPECGADERTGWREASPYDGLDLTDSAFTEEPSSPPRPATVAGLAWYWWLTGLALLVLLAAALLLRR
jgi:uncharacterized OB-fold protein